MDIQRLRLLSQRTSSLPQLPGTVPKLLSAIDGGSASVAEIARIISADTDVSAKVLCAASSSAHGFAAPVTTVKEAVLRLGQATIRRVAISIAVHSTFSDPTPAFDPVRFSRHCVFVGMLGRYLFARRLQRGDKATGWAPDDVFAAGLLHDIPAGILARVSPTTYAEVARLAEIRSLRISSAFFELFGVPISTLAEHALRAWNLPDPFVVTVNHIQEPWTYLDEFSALCALNYADWVAWQQGFGQGKWQLEAPPSDEVLAEVAVPEEELNLVLPQIEAAAVQMTANVGSRPAA